MSAYIINAAPMVIQQGTQDLSTVQLPRVPENIPQHCPKFYLWAKKGPLTPQLLAGAELVNMYGAETFDERGPYCNHSTVFVNQVNAAGNAMMIERVVPDDVGPMSNLILWLDVLETTVDDFERNADGSIKVDVAGNPIVAGTVTGHKVKWVVTHHDTVAKQNAFGEAIVVPGNQVDGSGNQSVRYPIFEFQAASPGAWANDIGLRLWAPTADSVMNMPTTMMAKERAYPFYFSGIRRKDSYSTPSVVETLMGDQAVMITMKPGTIDPVTESQLYMGDILLDSYQNLSDPRVPVTYGDFGKLAIYQDNIDLLLEQFHTAEIPFIDSFSDISAAPTDKYLFNFISGVSSQGVPYHSFQFVDDVDTVFLTDFSNLFARGGSNGTMNDAVFAQKVSERVVAYADPNSPLQETAINVESVLYDTGFPLQTKYDLCNFIAVRKDTFVSLATHEVGGPVMTAAEESSLAVALRTRLQLFPESTYFGTPVMRGMIVGRSGKLLNSRYNKRLPLTLEVAIKSAKYMGAGDGRWKNGSNFDGAPGSVIESMHDISLTWVPAKVRNKNWDIGLNWVQAYDRRSFFFPALKTVYDDDTSVLNSYFTAMAICYLNKVANAAHREFSGTSNLTNAQFAKRVNDFVTAKVQGAFDGRFVVVPSAFFTDMDLKRGYSWTLPIKIYSPNMKTVMTTYIQAHRLDDLQSAA